MKTTKKNFLNEFTSNKKLATKVLNQLGEDWSEVIQRPYDFRDAGAGVNGFIYYTETVPFAKKNHLLILQVIAEFEDELGEPLKKPNPTEETKYFNWLAWFALENTIDEVINFTEQ